MAVFGLVFYLLIFIFVSSLSLVSRPSFRWRVFEPMQLTGLKTFRICLWISALQESLMTLSDGVGESAAIVLAPMITMRRVPAIMRRKRSSLIARQSLNLTPHLSPLASLGLSQKQTLRPLSRSKCLKKKVQRLLKIPTCHSPWTTSGRTLLLSMSLQMHRVGNYIWVLSRIKHNQTLHGLVIQRGGGKEDLSHREPPKSNAPT